MKTTSTLAFFRSASLLILCSIATTKAETVLDGDYHIAEDSPEMGNLTIDGALSVGGDIDYGTTIISSLPLEAVILSYGESGSDYFIDSIGSQDAVTFRWRENNAGTTRTKMLLDADSALTLLAPDYNPASPLLGKITITPAITGSNITIDGASVITSDTYSGSGGILSLNTADTRYVSSNDISVDILTDLDWEETGAALALPGGTATAPYTYAGLYATASGIASTASGFGSIANEMLAVASGTHSYASGFASNASGTWSVASGSYSSASGINSNASAFYSTAAGPDTKASGFAQFVVGSNNIQQGSPDTWIETDDLFIIGNGLPTGYPAPPSNALTVKKNGNTWISGGLTVEQASRFNGRVRIEPQGDLSMGDFTSEPSP